MVGDIRHIVVIESLDNERKTGTELYNECIKRYIQYYKSTITHRLFTVRTVHELTQLLKYYQLDTQSSSGGILLHMEMHGDVYKKGLILADGNIITWGELVNLLRPINIITCNKLYVSLATCNGRWLYEAVSYRDKSPYSCYISASKDVYPDVIVEQFTSLFTKLIQYGNLCQAYLEMEEEGTDFFYKDSESTFESIIREVVGDPDLIKEAIENHYVITGKKSSDEEVRAVMNIVLQNLYKECKESFNFSDCD